MYYRAEGAGIGTGLGVSWWVAENVMGRKWGVGIISQGGKHVTAQGTRLAVPTKSHQKTEKNDKEMILETITSCVTRD